jgi:hypothetical protein
MVPTARLAVAALAAVALGALALGPGPVDADLPGPAPSSTVAAEEADRPTGTPARDPNPSAEAVPAGPVSDVDPKVDEVLYPLATVPEIAPAGSSFTLELDAEAADAVDEVDARLVPSFGEARAPIPLTTTVEDRADSTVWPTADVVRVTVQVPELGARDALVPGLHDLEIETEAFDDSQPRAVDVRREPLTEPTVAVVADPSVGDPRPVEQGARLAAEEQDPAPALDGAGAMAGSPTDPERWNAFATTIREVNLANPDLDCRTQCAYHLAAA